MKGCIVCGYMTDDAEATVCGNNPSHPPLVVLSEDKSDEQVEAPKPEASAVPDEQPAVSAITSAPVTPPPITPPKEPAAPQARDTGPRRATMRVRAPVEPTPEDEPIDPGDNVMGDIELTLTTLRELAAQKNPPLVIGLLGSSMTGKTWLMNRLKYELDADYLISPELKSAAHRPNRRVIGSRGVGLHRFVREANASQSFYVVDISGEQFQLELAARFSGRNRNLLEVMHLCSAYLYVMPAAGYLFTHDLFERDKLIPTLEGLSEREVKKLNREQYENIEAMDSTLGLMAVTINYLDARGGVDKALADGAVIDEKILLDFAENNRRRCHKPAAFVMTMADELQPAIDSLDGVNPALKTGGGVGFDINPLATTLAYRHKLIKRLHRGFKWWKVDFASAFFGHPGGDEPDYDLDHLGVLSLIAWFRAALKEARNPFSLIGGSAAAVQARSMLVPEFKQVWKSKIEPRV